MPLRFLSKALTIIQDDHLGKVNAVLLKELNDGTYIDLALNISVITDYSLRVQVDEIDRQLSIAGNITSPVTETRYNETSYWAFKESPQNIAFKHSLQSDMLSLQYGHDNDHQYKAEIFLYPFKINLFYRNVLQLVLNEGNLLNVEHYRSRKSEEKEDSRDVLPEESTFDAYNDEFKDSKGDTLPFGPESVAADIDLIGFSHVYGIPEHADSLSLKDTSDTEPYRLFNVDIFEYPVQSKYPMYGSIPFMVGVKPEASVGIFWVNSADTYVDITKTALSYVDDKAIDPIEGVDFSSVSTHWMSENGILDVILIAKDTPSEVSSCYGALTGYVELPNIFSLGYHQSRWNYNDEKDVLSVANSFDEHEIPCDAIWLDIDYADGKKYFTWKPDMFPEPERMEAKLNETGKKLVVIVDPHFKTGYEISDQLMKRGIAIRNSDGKDAYKGHCWPGESVWIDTLNPNSQEYWEELFSNGSNLLGYSTNVHLWNDMNEPSIFNGPETSAPKDLLHYGNWEHRSVHNLFGLTYHEATYRSLVARNPSIRPFVLTRSFFAGSQRTCAMWTGDNIAKWEYLRESIRMCLTMNVAGFPFAGADVGGFFHNPDSELLVRWYQTGIWYPFFRAHSHIDSRRREPYLIEQPYQSYIREALLLRYKLMPLLYTQFRKSYKSGMPILKPLFYDRPENPGTYSIDDEFFLENLLVKPIMAQNQTSVSMYLPDDRKYYNFFNFTETLQGEGYHDGIRAALNEVPVYLREGSMIPTKERYRRSAKLMTYDPYTLYFATDENGNAKGQLYVDDGESFGYRDNGDYLELEMSVERGSRIQSKVVGGSGNGLFTSTLDSVRVERIILINCNATGNSVTVQQGEQRWAVDLIEENGYNIIRNPAVSINKDWAITL
ncbi:hypothetical protein FOA43_001053 [Brettanomyces nanus]|uniref:Glucosidase II subunit alpha n=1 Tax=Eeniella nana TaxID=13502 RepID=A0A875RNH8_EENNA|nr:uncharacterized protein FOA43_001053 [Brettanomyces nanus]QPG73740.1 hypothetical protein FOA43_001053 [Brettanomyces nanus]